MSGVDLGLFDPREERRSDTLNRFEHWWATPVQFVLLLFGFANAGVPFERIGPRTLYVLAGFLPGKPVAFCCSRKSGWKPAQNAGSCRCRG
jgi:Na+/H+ antiporter NhaA